jgi:hypothetical protein
VDLEQEQENRKVTGKLINHDPCKMFKLRQSGICIF